METKKIISNEDNVRLDVYLTSQLNLTRSKITNLIKNKKVLVNDQVTKAGFILSIDDVITYSIDDVKPPMLDAVDLKLDIIYEDDDLIVVNKPKGLIVHPASSHNDVTLVHGLLYQLNHLSNINGSLRPGIIHRIDKDTEGLLLVAKNDNSHNLLAKQIENHEVKRNYYAICYGNFKEKSATINAPIGRHPKNRLKMAVVKTGKPSITHFDVLESKHNFSLLKCSLETGRTHQIRVHLSYINHPIVGDTVYGPSKAIVTGGQLLCAYRLEFIHPITKKAMVFEIPMPKHFNDFLDSVQ